MATIAIIATNTDHYERKPIPTGLWLSEVTHLYHAAKAAGHSITFASPRGGSIPFDPVSLQSLMIDSLTKRYLDDAQLREELANTKRISDIATEQFDCVYLAGGHGTMFDFPDNVPLQELVRTHFEQGRIVSAICHGVCGLVNVTLSDGTFLVKGKTLTGYDWFEESLANRKQVVPFNLEARLKEHGAIYDKALIPMTSQVVADGNLITGQNPFSSKEMAQVLIKNLTGF